MEEVRSYWQVASITHFCTIFGRPLKLPTFEPEELEQAFILEVPPPPQQQHHHQQSHRNDSNHLDSNNQQQQKADNHYSKYVHMNNGGQSTNDSNGYDDSQENDDNDDYDHPRGSNNINDTTNQHEDPDYSPPLHQTRNSTNQFKAPEPISQRQDEQQPQQELHLLVRLAIALLKPHFNCKISHNNWENYLHRIIDANWVELEKHPSPFEVPLVSQDGVELTKNLAFNELPLSDKIDIFYALCDYRLWCEDAPEAIKDFGLEELRLESIGKDSQSYEYWYFSGTRLFRENKEMFQDILLRKKRIKELEYKLVELEKTRISREQEEKRKAELEKAKQLANEARLAAKKQQEINASASGVNKRKKQPTPVLQPRTGLRERRSSAASNTQNTPRQAANTPTTRSRLAKQNQTSSEQEDESQQQTQSARSQPSRNSKLSDSRHDNSRSPAAPKKSPEEECKEELERLQITEADRKEAWCICCESLEEWEAFAVRYEKTKSTNEKYLMAHVNDYIMPHIRSVYNKKAAEARRKEKELILSLASRRVSSRIISKKAQEEEEERQAQLHEAEMRRKKSEAEARLRAELEREMKARQNRFVVNGTSEAVPEEVEEYSNNARYNLRQQQQLQESDEFGGIIHPDKLCEFYEALELIVDSVRTSKHAWPFVDPVPETVSGYYDLIKEPMDLRKLRTKIEFREYRSLIELERDFQLLVNNCERFNGPKNVYTKMVYKLWKSFRKNVRLYLQRDLSMDEYETFVYPPPKPEPKLPEESKDTTPERATYLANDVEMCYEDNEPKAPTPEPVTPVHVSEDIEKEGPSLEPICPIKSEPQPIEFDDEICPIGKTPEKTDSQVIELPKDNTLNLKHGPTLSLPRNNHLNASNSLEVKAPTPEPTAADCPPPLKVAKFENHCEEIIIDSYDVPCPDETFFLWSQDNNTVRPSK